MLPGVLVWLRDNFVDFVGGLKRWGSAVVVLRIRGRTSLHSGEIWNLRLLLRGEIMVILHERRACTVFSWVLGIVVIHKIICLRSEVLWKAWLIVGLAIRGYLSIPEVLILLKMDWRELVGR